MPDPKDFSDFEPERPEFFLGAPDPVFARLRDEDPIHWYEGEGSFWCLTRHADVRDVSSRPREFRSGDGIAIPMIARRQSGQAEGPPELRPMAAPSIIDLDPPRHNLQRKLVMDRFKPSAAAKLEGRLRQIARETVARVPVGERVDFVDAVAVPLPMITIAELLGVPEEDHDRFRVWSDAMVEASNGNPSEAVIAKIIEMFGYLGDQLARRRAEPTDDMISALLDAEVEGERLSEGELLMFCMILLVGGNETTRTLIAGGTRALLDNPEQRDKLLRDPTLLPNAIEEMLRYVAPLRHFARRAVKDTEVAGQPIRQDDFVVMLYAAANRDRSVFGADADAFVVDRPSARRHLSFGYGEHLCLGAALARLEARVMFEELLPRLGGLRYDGVVEPLRSIQINGIERMPVVFEK
jgi:cytochrome P450